MLGKECGGGERRGAPARPPAQTRQLIEEGGQLGSLDVVAWGGRSSAPVRKSGVVTRTSAIFHHVQLTADPRFRQALDQQVDMERLATGRIVHPAMMVSDALFHIEARLGDDVAARIAGLDLSVTARTGAVRVRRNEWRRAAVLAKRLHRSTTHPSPITWTPRAAIIAALYCYATEH